MLLVQLKAWRVNMDIQFVLDGARDRSKTGKYLLKYYSPPR